MTEKPISEEIEQREKDLWEGLRNLDEQVIHPDLFPGMDIAEGLKRFNGSWDLYINNLRNFCKTQKEFSADFRSHIKEKNFKIPAIMARALKGAANDISAQNLVIAAKMLADASDSENETLILEHLSYVETVLQQLIASLENTASENSHPRSPFL